MKELSKKNPAMQYYYLQGWNGNNKKLNYKANYEPEEFYCPCIVQGWVSSLGGVADAKNRVVEERNAGKPKQDNDETEQMVTEPSEPVEATDSTTTKSENKDKQTTKTDSKNKQIAAAGDSGKPPAPVHIECQAYPQDRQRYEQVHGQEGSGRSAR